MKLKNTLKKSRFFKIYKKIKYFKDTQEAKKNYLLQSNILRPEIVNVVFLAQYIPAWSKFESVYKSMVNDEKFNPVIVCVPGDIENDEINDTYQYFVNHGYECLDAKANSQWTNLEDLQPEYVFYTRPYNHFLPLGYRSDIVSRFAKVCCLQYGCPISALDFIEISMNRDFFKNSYYYFAGNDEEREIFIDRFELDHKFKIKKTVNCGLPCLEQLMDSKDKKSEILSNSENDIKVMWTPRWNTDESVGGSNFIRYYKEFLKIVSKNIDVDFIFRPHPMMFENFLNTGEMLNEEVEQFKKIIDQTDNLIYDDTNNYYCTMWKSSFLISDYSSIVVEYFATDKPIIYCLSENHQLQYTEYFKKILETNYVAHNYLDVVEYFKMLKCGEDPKKEERIKVRKEIFGDDYYSSSNRIITDIYKDSRSAKRNLV